VRLAVLVDTFPRWSERFIARELSELSRRGIDLTIFALKAGDLLEKDDPDWRGLNERTVILPYCVVPRLAWGLGKRSKLAARLDQVRTALDASAFSRLNCLPSLVKLLQQGRFTHVHAHFAGLPSTLAWLAAEELSLPFTLSVHARDVFIEPQLLTEKMVFARRVFCCHASACEHLKTLTSTLDKVLLMHHGLPLDPYRLTWRPTHRSGTLRMFSAGRFVEKKGYRALIEALPKPSARAPFELVLCGEGPEKKSIKAAISKARLQDAVTLKPPLGATGLLDEFRKADLFIAPFQKAADGDLDGIPNTVLEAFATGLPVAGTQAGGLKELLPHRSAAAAPDVRSLVAALMEIAGGAGEHLANIMTARQLIDDEYDLSRVIEPLLREIQA